jgi:hypothetical protein
MRGEYLFDPLEKGGEGVGGGCLAAKDEGVAALAACANANVFVASQAVDEDDEGGEEDGEGRRRERVPAALEDKLDKRKLRLRVNCARDRRLDHAGGRWSVVVRRQVRHSQVSQAIAPSLEQSLCHRPGTAAEKQIHR